jgi:hypothetical protein
MAIKCLLHMQHAVMAKMLGGTLQQGVALLALVEPLAGIGGQQSWRKLQ